MNSNRWSGTHPDTEQLGAFSDGELPPVEAASVEEHVASCAVCRKTLDELARLDALGPLLREDLPRDTDWRALEGRIRAEITGGPTPEAAEGAGPGLRRLIFPGEKRESFLDRWFRPGARLSWGLVTAAGLVIVVLTSRVAIERLSPGMLARPLPEARVAEKQAPVAPGEPPAGSGEAAQAMDDRTAAREAGERATAPPPAAPAPSPGTEDSRAEADRPSERTAVLLADEEVRKQASRTDNYSPGGPAPASTASNAAPSEVAVRNEAGRAPGEAAGAAAPAPKETFAADPALSGSAAAPEAALQEDVTISSPAGARNEALSYAALVDRELGQREKGAMQGEVQAEGMAADAVAPPADEDLEAKVAEAARDRKRAATKPSLADYRIAFAAALRALEAGNPSLARQGFSMVARGIPENELARDAEYNERLAQYRLRSIQGEDPELLLDELMGLADRAWDVAQEKRDLPTCRKALAFERLRLTWLEEVRPAIDREPWEERVRILRQCS